MRIRELYLKAFGPFTDQRIVFDASDSGPGPGLCVVHGPNEAGKSSALRAIRDLLYGIPARSTDNFRHAYPAMRVGARLVFSDGEELAFLRRKGTKDTLLSYDDAEPIADGRLDALARAVPASLFESFYGLDHVALSLGSKALLDDEGELGRALFAAGLGSGNLRAVLEALDQEANGLFKARGSNPRINATLNEYNDLQAEIRLRSLKPAEWLQQAKAAREVEGERARLAALLEKGHVERTRLDRIRRTLPALGRRNHACGALDALGAVRELAPDFEERLRGARTGRASGLESRERAEQALAHLEERRATLELSPALLEARERIEALGQRIGAYRDEVDQLPRREAKLSELEDEVRSILRIIGSTDAPARLAVLSASRGRSGRIQMLASESSDWEARLETATEQLERAHAAVARWECALEALPEAVDPAALRRSIERARRLGEIDERLAALGPVVEAREEDAERGLASLGFWSGSLEAIDWQAFPQSETVDVHAARFERLERESDALTQAVERVSGERRDVEAALSSLRAEGAVASEAERDAQRRARDSTWRKIRRELIEGEAGRGDPGDPVLPDRLESEIAAADQSADRLRDDAERIAHQSQLLAKRARLETDSQFLADQERRLEKEREGLEAAWRALWKPHGMTPGTPAEMRAWLERLRRLREQVETARAKRREWQTLCSERDQARGAVAAECRLLASEIDARDEAGAADRLDETLARAEALASRFEAEARRAAEVWQESEDARRQLEEAESVHGKSAEALDAWRREWRESVEGLGLSEAPRPVEALERLDVLTQLFERIRERDELAERVAKMRSEIDRFEADIAELVMRCAPDLDSAMTLDAWRRLSERAAKALTQDTLRSEIDASILRSHEERDASERMLRQSEEGLLALQAEARVEREEEIDEALRTWREWERARRELDGIEADLEEKGEGRSIADLEAEAKEIDPDALPGRIERLDLEIDEWTRALQSALTDLGARHHALSQMDGSADVARLAEAAQEKIATLSGDVRRHVTLRLAHEILGREIERYRQRNQTPVLGRASVLFSALTRGAYRGVGTDLDDADRAQLTALRADGGVVGVEALSSGARDQLFLALRLATLEESLERAEPMPLIADDILVEFDDARSRATLEVLADLGEKTQILLFSHHRHVAEQARELGDRARVVEIQALATSGPGPIASTRASGQPRLRSGPERPTPGSGSPGAT